MGKLSETLRSRWLSTGLHLGLWLLLLAVIGSGFRARGPQFQEAAGNSAAVTNPVPVAKLQLLFAANNFPKSVVNPATLNLFSTPHFIPRNVVAPSPTPAPAPPPPTTWKVELTYQGYYCSGDGPKYALVRVGEKLINIPVGGVVVTNLMVLDAGVQNLTLTNTAMQTNVLALNAKQVVEVPLK
jgi:hypothetical protein